MSTIADFLSATYYQIIYLCHPLTSVEEQVRGDDEPDLPFASDCSLSIVYYKFVCIV